MNVVFLGNSFKNSPLTTTLLLGLSPFTSSAAKVLNLQWDGLLQKGSPADFVLLDSNSWVQALSERPKRRVVVNGEFLNELPKNKKSTYHNSHP